MDRKVVHPYANYSVKDFDRYQCLKLSWWFYLVMIYLNRVYLVGLLSFANMKDKLQLIKIAYPQPETFYAALVISLPSLLFAYVVFFRKPEASQLVQFLWPKVIWLALIILLSEIVFFAIYSVVWSRDIGVEFYLQWLIALVVIAAGKFIPRVKLNLAEFPIKVEESKKPVK